MGIVGLAAGAFLAFVLVALRAPRLARIVIFFPIWFAALGLLQTREQICIALAARGMRNMDGGEEAIEDERLVKELRATSRRINRRAIVTAAIVTMVALAFPD
jgi:hypothetical protein